MRTPDMIDSVRAPANERCSRQARFGCGFAAMVILCLPLNYGVMSPND
jgi:hypothetical protein